MNEQNQAALLEAYIVACRQNADAAVPDGLDPEMAAFVRQLMRHKPALAQDERASDQRPLDERPLRERIWANALTAANAAPQAPMPAQPKNPTFSPNGHHKSVENDMLLTETEPIMVLPAPMRLPRRAIKSPSLLTVAATLALVFVGVLAMLRLNNGDGDQFGAGIFQGETPTPMETPPNTPESDLPPTPVPTNGDDMPPTPAPTNVDALPPTPAPTSTPFPTNVEAMPPTLVPTSTPIPFNADGRPQPCIPTEVPTITPPDWPTPSATPVALGSALAETTQATPVPMDATPIDCLLPTPIPVCQVIITSAEGAQLRSRATEESALLASPELGQYMTVIFQETGVDSQEWYLVEYEIDGIRAMGYVREDYVQIQSGSICPPPTPTLIPLTALPPTVMPPTPTPLIDRPPLTSTPTAFLPTSTPGN